MNPRRRSPLPACHISCPENRMSASHPSRRFAFAAALLAGTSLGGLAVPALAQPEPVNPPVQTAQHAMLPDFSDLVARVKPAVVSITTTITTARAGEQRPPLP